MQKITVKDGTEIYYKDWGNWSADRLPPWSGPFPADDWDAQMMFLSAAWVSRHPPTTWGAWPFYTNLATGNDTWIPTLQTSPS